MLSGHFFRLAVCKDFLRAPAKGKNCAPAELNADMQKELAARHAKYPGINGYLLTVEGVHMNPLGDRMMGHGILRAFGLTDSIYWRVTRSSSSSSQRSRPTCSAKV